MKKLLFLLSLLLTASFLLNGQEYKKKNVRPVKNVILMIPDGTNMSIVSASRWYSKYNKLGEGLNIDPYLCGTVTTFCSNAPIGDSAPTTSCYMTGIPQRERNVSIYPVSEPENDLYPFDPTMADQPLATILEASKIEQNKATGLVATVYFPHATPADCSAHHYKRSRYDEISSQMVHQNIDVVLAAGNKYLTSDLKDHLSKKGTTLIQNDVQAMLNYSGDKIWALFGDEQFPFDIDRNPEEIPSLEQMTKKAIEVLSKKEEGFFLMVEGSEIDWTAHANDPVGCITEYLAFDKAVGAALEFARKDGETAVIILPDHATGGFSIGRYDLKNYTSTTLEGLFGKLSKYKRTAYGMEAILLKTKPEDFKRTIKKYLDIDITEDELKELLSSKNYGDGDYMQVANSKNMVSTITAIMNKHTYFGFSTSGHTGEEVFLAVYHPQGDIPIGMNMNYEINHYLFDVSGLKTRLPDLTKQIFAKHSEVFAGLKYSIDKSESEKMPTLIVKKGKKTMKIPAFQSVATINGKSFDLGSVTVYIDRNDTFYLPANLIEKLD